MARIDYLTSAKHRVYSTLVNPDPRLRFVPHSSTSLIIVLGCWLVTSSLWLYPHSLSYFNEVIGGPLNGPRHLLGSNVDWGQDLRYVKWWLDGKGSKRIGDEAIYAANSNGGYQPFEVGIPCVSIEKWSPSPSDKKIQDRTCIVCAAFWRASSSNIFSAPQSLVKFHFGPTMAPAMFCGILPHHIGYSLLAYESE